MAVDRDPRYAHELPALSERLRALRETAGLTQAQVAERAHLSVTMVQNLERPSYQANPRLTTMYAMAEALGVDLVDVLGLGAPARNRHARRG